MDITKCMGKKDTGEDCPKKSTCYRHTATDTPGWQAWFVASPWFNGDCEMYWRDEDATSNVGN